MNKDLVVLLKAVREAGDRILLLRENNLQTHYKLNRDMVTQGDFEANAILKARLMAAFPNDGWLSEESVDDLNRLKAECVWIVDPIDGTKEYASGVPEFAISVARVKGGEPLLGAVYNPATDELFYAVKGGGAWLGDQPIRCRALSDKECLLLASRSEVARGEWEGFKRVPFTIKPIGSIAYKLALVAAGFAEATFSLGPKNEWDIAAGVLLVREAGGVVTDQYRRSFLFNQEKVLVPGIVATSLAANDFIFEGIASC